MWPTNASSEVTRKLESLRVVYAVQDDDLRFKWEALSLRRNAPSDSVSLDLLHELETELAAEQAATRSASLASTGLKSRTSTGPRRSFTGELATKNNLLDSLIDGTPLKKPRASLGEPHAGSAFLTPNRPVSGSTLRSSALGSSPLSAMTSTPPPASRSPTSLDPSTPAGPPATPFRLRDAPFTVQDTLNPHLRAPDQARRRAGDKPKTTLATHRDVKQFNYRYMFEKMLERSAVLDTSIDRLGLLCQSYYELPAYSDPSVPTQTSVFTFGRLCPSLANAPTSSTPGSSAHATSLQKLSDSNVTLEASRMMGNGKRVDVRFDKDVRFRGGQGEGGAGMFSGMLCGMRGKNGGGRLLGVEEIISMPPLDPTYSEPQDVLSSQYDEGKLAGEPMVTAVACGPFTVESDWAFDPLRELLDRLRDDKPDFVLLVGPFVDCEHPSIRQATADTLPGDIFANKVVPLLNDFLDACPRAQVALVPSPRDLTSQHLGFPQSAFERDTRLQKRIKLLPNPVTFSVNEVSFGVSSVDVLFAIRNQEFFRKCSEPEDDFNFAEDTTDVPMKQSAPPDVLARMCRHVLRQRSFYPLFPAPQMPGGDYQVALDMTHAELLSISENGPDVMILPSRLKTFSKIVDSTLMINPAHLVRGHSAGTYARMTIYPLDKAELERKVKDEPDEPIEHHVYDRCRVDIVRI